MHNKRTLFAVIIFAAVFVTDGFAPNCVQADRLNTGVILADDHGTILYSQNKERQFVPASILKILTSLAAIRILGEDYRFPTAYFFNETSKDLYIKGFGDPLFISEVIEQLCRDILLKTNTKQIRHIILDQTYFSDRIQIPGTSNSLNPYDAPVGALCANFNTIVFKWDHHNKKFISGEPQTPLLSIFHDDINKTRLRHGRIIFSKEQSRLYAGLLVKYFLKKNKVNITGSVLLSAFEINQGTPQIFLSPFSMKDVVQKLLKYSNNYMANLLFLAIGAASYQTPATLEKGIQTVKLFSKKHLKLNDFIMSEGSGLSRSNLIAPDQMMKILIEFMPYYSLLNNQGNDFFKTGTLSGVRTRAGYILDKNKRRYPYVIMINQKNKGYESIRRNLLDKVSQINSNQD